ncbi:unnamed protein product, partial [Meganyctiphanes norvegica]
MRSFKRIMFFTQGPATDCRTYGSATADDKDIALHVLLSDSNALILNAIVKRNDSSTAAVSAIWICIDVFYKPTKENYPSKNDKCSAKEKYLQCSATWSPVPQQNVLGDRTKGTPLVDVFKKIITIDAESVLLCQRHSYTVDNSSYMLISGSGGMAHAAASRWNFTLLNNMVLYTNSVLSFSTANGNFFMTLLVIRKRPFVFLVFRTPKHTAATLPGNLENAVILKPNREKKLSLKTARKFRFRKSKLNSLLTTPCMQQREEVNEKEGLFLSQNGRIHEKIIIKKKKAKKHLSPVTTSSSVPSSTEMSGMEDEQVVIQSKNEAERPVSVFAQPGILAAFIGGAVVGLLCAILLVMFIVYRMRKKDEGSYPLDEPKRMPLTSSYSPNDKEIYA